MGDLPDRARAVIIGAGIMGSALVHHLALQGWRDLVLVDQGPFPNTGGSTGHSSAMVWLPEASRLLTASSADSVRQYQELGVHKTVGGLDLARTPERVADYRRRLGLIRTWGDYRAELLSPAEVKSLVPYLDESILLGGLHLPQTGVVDAIRAGTLMREAAIAAGALEAFPLTEVTGLDVDRGRVTGVLTGRGTVRTGTVVICCGVWSPRIARMAGALIPFTPGIQQLVSVGPIAAFANLPGEIDFPIVRDSDVKIYARRVGGDMEVGSVAHRPMLVDPDDIPSLAEATLTPTELPFTPDDFDASLEHALELFPTLFEDERAGIRYAINGLSSMSADGLPMIGEQPEVRGLWSANRVDIKMAPAVARTLATWLVKGMPESALHPFDIARFLPHERTQAHVHARATESWSRMYEILHPGRELTSNRGLRLSPVHERLATLGGVLSDQAGWEVAKWYGANEPLLARYGNRTLPRTHEWDARWWSPIVNAEHLAVHEPAGLGVEDLSARAMFEVTGPGAAGWLDGLAVERVNVPPGHAIPTWLLDSAGSVVSEVTVVRLAPERFLVMSPATGETREAKWLTWHLPSSGDVELRNVTGAWGMFGAWGSGAAGLLRAAGAAGPAGASPSAAPAGAIPPVTIGGVEAHLVEGGRPGGPAWEVLMPAAAALPAWDALWAAGTPLGVIALGTGVSGTTTRLEAGARSRGLDFVGGYNLVEAGLGRPAKEADFVGRAAYLDQLGRAPAAILCTLVVDDQHGPDGQRRFMLGGEPVTDRAGAVLIDSNGRRSCVTSAGSAPRLGRHLLFAYLPVERAQPGETLAVEYFGDSYPVTVVAIGAVPPPGLPVPVTLGR